MNDWIKETLKLGAELNGANIKADRWKKQNQELRAQLAIAVDGLELELTKYEWMVMQVTKYSGLAGRAVHRIKQTLDKIKLKPHVVVDCTCFHLEDQWFSREKGHARTNNKGTLIVWDKDEDKEQWLEENPDHYE